MHVILDDGNVHHVLSMPISMKCVVIWLVMAHKLRASGRSRAAVLKGTSFPPEENRLHQHVQNISDVSVLNATYSLGVLPWQSEID